MYDSNFRSFRLDNISALEYQLAAISPEFENTVISHILGNYMKHSPFPLYLAVHGPKGEGKSFQTLRSCSKYGIEIYYVSGAELCGSYEKDSITLIEKNLDMAIYEYKENQTLSAFIIDDFHLSIASVGEGVSKTVNSQILTGWLMNLADRARAGGPLRVPFILLGNDFTNLYAPLTRDGRMDFYEWKPSEEEKAKMICAHFEDYIQDKDTMTSFREVVKEYKNQPISFFAELKNDLIKSLIKEHIFSQGITDSAEILQQINEISEELIKNRSFDIVEHLQALAAMRKAEADAKLVQHESRKNL